MRPRPTDAEFDELKRKRDDGLRETVAKLCEEYGWDPTQAHVHTSPCLNDCYCACPDGPCQHIWDGPEFTDEPEGGGFMSSATCSRCGTVAMYHDMRFAP